MDATKPKQRIWLLITLDIIFLVFGIVIAVGDLYLSDYYPADKEAITAFEASFGRSFPPLTPGDMILEPKDAQIGLIFYPAGKVETQAYQPLMAALANRGILCVVPQMPFHMAIFDIDAADAIRQQFPYVERWYLGGHGLGGSMAATYLGDHADEYEGLILLGSYSTEDLSHTDLNVLSIYGSEDQVLNMDKYQKNKSNLPDDFTQFVIEGGCHTNFGMYGPHKGDGSPTISCSDQIYTTAETILNFFPRQPPSQS